MFTIDTIGGEGNAICDKQVAFLLYIRGLRWVSNKVREKRGTSARKRLIFAYLVSIYIV